MKSTEALFEIIDWIKATAPERSEKLFMHQEWTLLERSYCLRKEAEYRAKARTATELNTRLAFEAAASEYAHRANIPNKSRSLRPPRDVGGVAKLTPK
jgi:hypothetical protein